MKIFYQDSCVCILHLYSRAVAQRCPYPPMINLISFGGQHQGNVLLLFIYDCLFIHDYLSMIT